MFCPRCDNEVEELTDLELCERCTEKQMEEWEDEQKYLEQYYYDTR